MSRPDPSCKLVEERGYMPLSDRLQQDVMHDNFVPKYSGLSTARPSLLVLAGVWLIFFPMLVTPIVFLVPFLTQARHGAMTVVAALMHAVASAFAALILVVQTRRYRRYARPK